MIIIIRWSRVTGIAITFTFFVICTPWNNGNHSQDTNTCSLPMSTCCLLLSTCVYALSTCVYVLSTCEIVTVIIIIRWSRVTGIAITFTFFVIYTPWNNGNHSQDTNTCSLPMSTCCLLLSTCVFVIGLRRRAGTVTLESCVVPYMIYEQQPFG